MTDSSRTIKEQKRKTPAPTGIGEIDRLANISPCRVEDYLTGVSAYVRKGGGLTAGPKKAAQIRLSNGLARSLAEELSSQLPQLKGKLVTDEQKIAGGLRTANADVSQIHPLDGLRLAIELKPINLAVGRAIWNRFGDIRTFAVNVHLKFPFAVVGGVLVIPTYEETGTKAATAAAQAEGREEGIPAEVDGSPVMRSEGDAEFDSIVEPASSTPTKKSTIHLIERAVERLMRAGGRKSEADAAHLLEGIAVVVYSPDTGELDAGLPKKGSGLRWEEFVEAMVTSYKARFED